MTEQDSDYKKHLSRLRRSYTGYMDDLDLDTILIPAGMNTVYLDDDQFPPFHANPNFLRWLPYHDCEKSWIVVHPSESPSLLWMQATDYWYSAAVPPEPYVHEFNVQISTNVEQLQRGLVRLRTGRTAVLGPDEFKLENISPSTHDQLVNRVTYDRAHKTDFEISNHELATERAVRGHRAAHESFFAGGSEYDIHMAYLRASQQIESALPYPNIVCLNSHASVLHYQHYEIQPPDQSLSLLIDAGAKYQCAHADITRTYTTTSGLFEDLIGAVHRHQQQIISEISVGKNFVDLHLRMHEFIGEILIGSEIFAGSVDACINTGVSRVFFPHGLGHLLGLQTHDIGGFLEGYNGDERMPPEQDSTLRLTRPIEAGMIFTIEPGIYFIEVLLAGIRDRTDINWKGVDSLIPYGGIRIEDNVYIGRNSVRNLTRAAFASAQHPD